MKRKIFFIILALLCVAGAVVLVVVGIRATSHPAVIPGLESLGEVTLEAYEARRGESTEDEPYTIYYRYIDPKYGEIVFANAVSDEDYYSFLYDRMRAGRRGAGGDRRDHKAHYDQALRLRLSRGRALRSSVRGSVHGPHRRIRSHRPVAEGLRNVLLYRRGHTAACGRVSAVPRVYGRAYPGTCVPLGTKQTVTNPKQKSAE